MIDIVFTLVLREENLSKFTTTHQLEPKLTIISIDCNEFEKMCVDQGIPLFKIFYTSNCKLTILNAQTNEFRKFKFLRKEFSKPTPDAFFANEDATIYLKLKEANI